MSDCWYQEKWLDEDLENALIEANISVNEANIEKLKKECLHIFDDKSERNIMLREMAERTFNK